MIQLNAIIKEIDDIFYYEMYNKLKTSSVYVNMEGSLISDNLLYACIYVCIKSR